jgi:hypothetical protein
MTPAHSPRGGLQQVRRLGAIEYLPNVATSQTIDFKIDASAGGRSM